MRKLEIKEQLLILTASFSIVTAIASMIAIFFLLSINGMFSARTGFLLVALVTNFIFLVLSYILISKNHKIADTVFYVSSVYTMISLIVYQYVVEFSFIATMSIFIFIYYVVMLRRFRLGCS